MFIQTFQYGTFNLKCVQQLYYVCIPSFLFAYIQLFIILYIAVNCMYNVHVHTHT